MATGAASSDVPSNGEYYSNNHSVFSLIVRCLTPTDLFRAQCVCTEWRDTASCGEVLRHCFCSLWELSKLKGQPRNSSLWGMAKTENFAVKHQLQSGDTLMKLAVQHGVGLHLIKRMNNLISDHSLHSRNYLYIPVNSPDKIKEGFARFEYCTLACRDIIVLGAPEDEVEEPVADECSNKVSQEKANTKLCKLVGRCLRVDDEVAKFYMEDCGYNIKEAMQQYEADERFERRYIPIRKALVQDWIEGQYGF